MRTQLAILFAVGLSCGGACFAPGARAQGGDIDRIHLSGALGRFLGIGYSAGYHAHYAPSRPGSEHELHSFAAPAYLPGSTPGAAIGPAYGTPLGPAMCPQCSTYQSSAPASSPAAHAMPSLEPNPAPTGRARPEPIQQPLHDAASPSDRTGFMKRLPGPSVRRDASVSDLPVFPAPPKKASVARSSILEAEAR